MADQNHGNAVPHPAVMPNLDVDPDPGVPRFRAREQTPPVFQGTSAEDVVDWWGWYQQVSVCNHWTPVQQLRNFGMYLSGIARKWFLSLNPMPLTIENMRDELFAMFKKPDYVHDLKRQLSARIQRIDEPVSEYFCDVIYLCSKIDPNMTDEMKIEHLLRGLKPLLLDRVYPSLKDRPNPPTLRDFLNLVQIHFQATTLANRQAFVQNVPNVAPSIPNLFVAPSKKLDTNLVTKEELNEALATLKNETSICLSSFKTEMIESNKELLNGFKELLHDTSASK